MTPEQFETIQNTIKETIKATVNGKIDRIDSKIDAYIKGDDEWKERANPILEMGANLRGFGKVMAYLLATAAAVYGLIKLK